MKTAARKILILMICIILFSGCASSNAAPGSNTADLIDYTHKQLIFHLKIPANWKVDEQTSFTNFASPDNSGSIQIAAVNTGIELNELGFANFVDATEVSTFVRFLNYIQVDRTVDYTNGLATIHTTLDINKVPQKIFSIYKEQGKTVFYMLFQSDAIAFEKNNSLFEQIIPTSEFDSTLAADLIPYNIVDNFSGPNNLFTLNIPSNWMYENNRSGNTIQDTFISPDNHAKIQNIAYNDGKAISRDQADVIALELLHENYAKDVRISEDQTQPDLSIRWIWSSKTGNIEGTTFYETRGNSFLMLTLLSDTEYKNIFDPLFTLIIQSYKLPNQ